MRAAAVGIGLAIDIHRISFALSMRTVIFQVTPAGIFLWWLIGLDHPVIIIRQLPEPFLHDPLIHRKLIAPLSLILHHRHLGGLHTIVQPRPPLSLRITPQNN